jgi:hypothetical protein
MMVGLSCRTDRISMEERVNWPDFIRKQDPVWERLPEKWYDAPFLGNGQLGTLIRKIGENEVRWDLGESFVHDHRAPDDYAVRSPEILNRGRLPIGYFVLETEGRITGGTIRLDLWDAEATGIITTEKGKIDWRTLVHAEDMVFLVEFFPSSGEKDMGFRFIPEKAESSRLTYNRSRLPQKFLDGYTPNPDPRIRELASGIQACEQSLIAGGMTTTAWKEEITGRKRTILVTCQHSYPETDATQEAEMALTKAGNTERTDWIEKHRIWWHDYYPQSFVSISDPVWESFYWIQMYKLACATRENRALIDNQGPWLQPTPWNGTWWNLNVQLSYSPIPCANRLELGESLVRHLKANFQNLIDNVDEQYRHDSAGLSRNTSMLDLKGKVGKPGGWAHPNNDIGSEVGNLAWTCHNLYTLYLSSQDESLLKDLLYPVLKRAVNYYRHFFFEGEDGRWHLPPTHSPEYGNAPDCNYDLSLIRWGCQTLIELAGKLREDEDKIPVWDKICEKLVDYPQNENGFMVGAGLGYDRSHRHWSHLLMIYPLRLVNPENGGEEIIRRSLNRWHSFPDALVGYSFTSGAAMRALLREGDGALDYLNGLLPFLGASTMYYEGGEAALPVMETPLHGASCIQEMLLQSWGNRIRVFPALPKKWDAVCFRDLRAEGAFLVSAVRWVGKTAWIRIKSLAGESCFLETDIEEPTGFRNGSRVELVMTDDGSYELPIEKGEDIVLVAANFSEPIFINQVESKDTRANFFGLKREN